MKTNCSPSIRHALSLAGVCLTLPLLAGVTGGTLTEEFNTADADTSGALSEVEFSTAYSTGLSRGKLKKQFRTADTDKNREISLEEYLAFRAAAILKDPNADPSLKFEVADLDIDGFLSLQEFAVLVPGKKPLIEKRKRHLMADADDDDLVTLDEFLNYVESPQPDTSGIPFLKFDLADLDSNDELTTEEFAGVYPPAVKPEVIDRKLAGRDANEDGVLTRDEWNPGGTTAP
jgi:Ca2+-binding EF-hand superfamily protein